MHDDVIRKEKSTIMQLYLLLVFILVCTFIPYGMVQLLALVLFLVLTFAVPMYMHAAPQGTILKSHMKYMNKTIWMGSLYLSIGTLVMAYWVYKGADSTAVTSLMTHVQDGNLVDEAQIKGSMDSYLVTNAGLLVKAGLVCLGPPMLYIAIRIIKALGRAGDGEPMKTFWDV